MGIVHTAIGPPPDAEAVTGKFTGIMAGTQLDVAHIEPHVIEAVRNDHALGKALEIVIISPELFQRIQPAIAIESTE